MRSKTYPNRYYIECGCHATDHLLVFDISRYENTNKIESVDVYITVTGHETLWGRIKIAVGSIFNPNKYLVANDVLINKYNIAELKEMIDIMERNG